MSNMLKCPNPSCPYIFDPSLVPVGVVLSCPRCAMQFTLGPPTAAPATAPGYSAPPPPPPPPRAEPVGPERGAGRRAAAEERDPYATLPGRRTNTVQVFVLAGIAAVLLAGTGLAVLFGLFFRRDESVPADTVTRLQDLNVAFESPPAGWSRDDDTRNKIGSPYLLAYKRESPEAYMAFGASDFKTTSPRQSELLEGRELPLRKLFDYSSFRREPSEAAQWMGEPVGGTRFRIQSTEGLNWQGEVYSVAHKGVAYWWVSWCGENDFDALKDEFASFRDKFKLLDLRKDWKEKQANVVHYKGERVNYTISDAEGLWRETPIDDFKKEEPELDKRLRIDSTPKRDRKALPDEAELRVYLLDAADDPRAAARRFAEGLETARIRAANAALTPPAFEELTGEVEGDPSPDTVPAVAPVVRLRSTVKESRDASRLIVVSGVRVGDKVVVVRCWCEWGKRGVFETKFVQIAASLREGK